MPVPNLTASIQKYLTAVKPFLNEHEFENTRRVGLINKIKS